MRDFAGFVDKDAVVRAHARVDHADVGCDERDFRERGWVDEGRRGFLFGGEDDSVGGFDAEGCNALVHGIEGVFDLDELAASSRSVEDAGGWWMAYLGEKVVREKE